MNLADVSFPVLTFGHDRSERGGAAFTEPDRYATREGFARCWASEVRDRSRVGLELIDSAGRAWRVTDMRRGPPTRPFWRHLVMSWFGLGAYEVEFDLASLDPPSLTAVKADLCAWIDTAPQSVWLGEPEDPAQPYSPELQAELAYARSSVMACDSFAELMDLEFIDEFY